MEYYVYKFYGQDNDTASPLLLLLHGNLSCAKVISDLTNMSWFADRHNFAVVYPEIPTPAGSCGCWDANADLTGDSVTARLLWEVVNRTSGALAVDSSSVFIAGFSGGAAMSVATGAIFPDVFHGIGSGSGYGYGMNLTEPTQNLTKARQNGQLAYSIFTGSLSMSPLPRMPIIVFQGESDPAVLPIRAEEINVEFSEIADLEDDHGSNDTTSDTWGYCLKVSMNSLQTLYYRHYYSADTSLNTSLSGKVLSERYMVEGMQHQWSGGEATDLDLAPFSFGGDLLSVPNESELMWDFFSRVRANAPLAMPGSNTTCA